MDLSWAPPLCRHLKEQPWGGLSQPPECPCFWAHPIPQHLMPARGTPSPPREEARRQAWCTPIRRSQHVLSLAPYLATFNMTSPHPAKATRTQKGTRGSLRLPLARHTLYPVHASRQALGGLSLRNTLLPPLLPLASTNLLYLKPKARGCRTLKTLFFQTPSRSRAVKG